MSSDRCDPIKRSRLYSYLLLLFKFVCLLCVSNFSYPRVYTPSNMSNMSEELNTSKQTDIYTPPHRQERREVNKERNEDANKQKTSYRSERKPPQHPLESKQTAAIRNGVNLYSRTLLIQTPWIVEICSYSRNRFFLTISLQVQTVRKNDGN